MIVTGLQGTQRGLLVRAHHAAEALDVGAQDRRQPAGDLVGFHVAKFMREPLWRVKCATGLCEPGV
jgi:hypothetical protein